MKLQPFQLTCLFYLQCFTSIVGPNGSGKSNVIDSMLFVFGYRAKQIRSKKVSVLIHNSEQHQNITSCTVSVHFQKIVDLVGYGVWYDTMGGCSCGILTSMGLGSVEMWVSCLFIVEGTTFLRQSL